MQRSDIVLINFPFRGYVVLWVHGGIVRYFVVTAGRRPSPIYLNLFVRPICSHDKVSYNTLVLETSTSTRPIHFHLQAAAIDAKPAAILLDLPSDIIDRSAFMYSALDSGWFRIAYRKDDGSTAIRLGTRNPTLVAKYGSRYDVTGIKNSEFSPNVLDTIVYFDHIAGALRCFRVMRVDGFGIDAESFENNH